MLSTVQQLLVRACHAADPSAFLRERLDAEAPNLDPDERAMLQALDDDGLRLTRLLVRKLRLERLLRGDPAAAAAFAADPAAFLAGFRRYCDEVAPTAVFPSEEAAAFAAHARRPDA